MTNVITKKLVRSCQMCQIEIPHIPDPNFVAENEEQTPDLIDDPNWIGVPGYAVRDEDYSWRDNITLCATCTEKFIKAVNLIKLQKLVSVEL